MEYTNRPDKKCALRHKPKRFASQVIAPPDKRGQCEKPFIYERPVKDTTPNVYKD